MIIERHRGQKPAAAPVAAWRAATASGVAHAFARRRSPYAYCGVHNWEPRFDHPSKTRCPECLELTGGVV